MRKMKRCQPCELRTRCTQDLRKYVEAYDLPISELEMRNAANNCNIDHIPKGRFKKLVEANVKICIDWDNAKNATLNAFYFSEKCVKLHSSWQQKSARWHQDGKICQQAVRMWNYTRLGDSGLVMVNKAYVQATQGKAQHSICDLTDVVPNGDEEVMVMNGKL